MSKLWLIFSLICSFLLTSCGFQLRGQVNLSPPLHNIYIKTNDPYGQTANNLKQALEFSHVHVTDNPKDASVIFVILREETGQQLLSVGGTQQTRQYNIILTVTFQLTDREGKVLIPPQAITEMQPVTIQANQILAGSNEMNYLYQRTRLAIVYDIMNRLASDDVTRTLMKYS